MNIPHLVVRAIDVGYGHVKFTDGREAENGDLRTLHYVAGGQFLVTGEAIEVQPHRA